MTIYKDPIKNPINTPRQLRPYPRFFIIYMHAIIKKKSKIVPIDIYPFFKYINY